MRRLLLACLGACGAALLSACSGEGGSAFNFGGNNAIDRVAFTNGSGALVGTFFVSPTVQPTQATNQPINPAKITAVGVKGINNVIVPDATFTWGATYAPAGTLYTYTTGLSPITNRCGTPPAAASPPVIWIANNAGASVPASFTKPAVGQATNEIFIGATPGATAPYCIEVVATAINTGQQGSALVVVSNTP